MNTEAALRVTLDWLDSGRQGPLRVDLVALLIAGRDLRGFSEFNPHLVGLAEQADRALDAALEEVRAEWAGVATRRLIALWREAAPEIAELRALGVEVEPPRVAGIPLLGD